MSHVIIIVSPTSTTYPTDFQLVAEPKAATPGTLGSIRSLLLRRLPSRKQRTVTLSGVAARHGTGSSHSLISTGYCLRINRSWFRILLAMLGAHLVSTQAPDSEGGIMDNEPKCAATAQPVPVSPTREESLICTNCTSQCRIARNQCRTEDAVGCRCLWRRRCSAV